MFFISVELNKSQAIALNNSVPQGLSSSLFTRDQRNVFQWTSSLGSDCGLGEKE